MLCPIDVMILFFRENRLYVATTLDVYETRVESSDNDLTNLKRGTGQTPRKLVNANQPRRNNNLNTGPKK